MFIEQAFLKKILAANCCSKSRHF